MRNGQVRLRKMRLLEDHAAAKRKMQMLREDARREAKVLEGLAEFLKSGGGAGVARSWVAAGSTLESYLSGPLAKLIQDLLNAGDELDVLRRKLADLGVTVRD
jgi:hypothetical protein